MRMSIAIPTWECHGRGGEFLDDLLRTIEIQSFKDFEWVVGNDGSDDNTDILIKKYIKEKKIRIIN